MARFRFSSRRAFLKAGITTTTGLGLMGRSTKLYAGEKEPHFFLHLFIPGGMDATYTFDARPLAMTAAKLQQNYIGLESTEIVGTNGGKSLRTDLVNPVLPFLNKFSVLNGVVMAPDFDGHEDNQSVLLTGNPLGGSSFHGLLGTAFATPISAVIGGAAMVSDSRVETSGGVKLTAKTAKELSKRLGNGARIEDDQRLAKFFKDRFAVGAKEAGSFAKTKLLMGHAINDIPNLARAISTMDIPEVTGETETVLDGVKLAVSAFKSDVTHSALCVFNTDLSENQNLDAHDFEGGKAQPRIIGEVMTELAEILGHLSNTVFTESQSMLDVTTVLVTSEFGRTMRQRNFDESGTDHNPLTNTMLLGGKGIKGGLILGASDFSSVTDFEKNVSNAHLTLDPNKMKIMGRPFDFEASVPSMINPEQFDGEHYLTANSVVNTLFSLFKVPQTDWRTLTRNGPPAKVLSSLIG